MSFDEKVNSEEDHQVCGVKSNIFNRYLRMSTLCQAKVPVPMEFMF